VACRLHQVLCELIPGGVPGQITAGQAGRILESLTPADTVQAARCQLAAGLTEDLRGVDAAIRETRKKIAAAARAAGTSSHSTWCSRQATWVRARPRSW